MVTGSEKVTAKSVSTPRPSAPSAGLVSPVTAGESSTVVKPRSIGALSESGGSPSSASVMAAAAAVTEQSDVVGSGSSGSRVTTSVPEPVSVKERADPEQVSARAPGVTSTDWLKVRTMLADASTAFAPADGVDELSAGGESVVKVKV